jgi:hypothetical protein
VGSPALATYSLTFTLLNGEWIASRFTSSDFKHRHTRHAIRVLSGLQQVPLRVSSAFGLLDFLVTLPENDGFWEKLEERLDAEANTWNVPAAASILWVLVAYVFTIIASFEEIGQGFSSWGQAVGSAWCWLIAIVTGWLLISPKCDQKRVESAVEYANSDVFDQDPINGAARRLNLHGDRAIYILSSDHSLYSDEKASQPVFNYARVLPWTAVAETVREQLQLDSRRIRPLVADISTPLNSAPPCGFQAFPALGSASTVTQPLIDSYSSLHRSRWSPGLFRKTIVALLAALALQWSTTGSAIVVHYFTPAIVCGIFFILSRFITNTHEGLGLPIAFLFDIWWSIYDSSRIACCLQLLSACSLPVLRRNLDAASSYEPPSLGMAFDHSSQIRPYACFRERRRIYRRLHSALQ